MSYIRTNRTRLGSITWGTRTLGDASADTFIDPQTGCTLDSDGNLLTCPNPSTGKQETGIDPYTQIGLQQYQPPQQPQPSGVGWKNFTQWLGEPVMQGWPSNGTVIGLTAVGTVLLGMVGKIGGGGGRKRR